jgi:NitT/TauT family transport system permease protein
MTATREELPPRGRRRLRWDVPTLLWSAALLAALLLGWWGFSAAVDARLFPSPIAVVLAFGDLIASGELAAAGLSTLTTFALALALAIVAGIALGLLVATSRLAGAVVNPYATALYATPVLVLVPLIIIWLGVNEWGRLAIVFVAALVPIYMNAEAGFRNARRDLVEVARSFGVGGGLLLREVVLPGALPFIMTGIKIGVGRGLGGVIVAELFLDLSGLGGLIQTSAAYFKVDRMIAGSIVLAVGGVLLMFIATRLEDRFDAWRNR